LHVAGVVGMSMMIDAVDVDVVVCAVVVAAAHVVALCLFYE